MAISVCSLHRLPAVLSMLHHRGDHDQMFRIRILESDLSTTFNVALQTYEKII